MGKLTEKEVEKLQLKFIGKKISVIDGNKQKWIGKCDWLGYNQNIPSWHFQVTMERTPLRNVEINSIKIID